MMDVKEWEKGIEAWERVKKQAEIDKEQAELYISAIKEKMESLDKKTKEVN